MIVTKISRGHDEYVFYVEDMNDDSVFIGPFLTETDAHIFIELKIKE